MCKDKQRPKLPEGEQGLLFDPAGHAGRTPGGGTTRQARQAALASRLTEQRSLTVNILDKIASYGALGEAFQAVQHNGGAAGIDGVTVEQYAAEVSNQVQQLHTALLTETYRPQAVRGVQIPKASGGTRQLGIPTIADRVVQQSIQTALQVVYDPYFSTYSYGFRPGRSAGQAVEQAAKYVQEGNIWVVDIDLKNFFDEINHDRLMSRLGKAITDKRLLTLIRRYLRAGLMQDGLVSQRVAGTPQGGPLSPLLSNIVLDELDGELEARGLSFARYADDCNIFVGSKRAAERVLTSLIRFIEETLKLKVNREKSGVRRCDEVKFLGYTIETNGKIRVADEGVERFKRKLRTMTKRNRSIPGKRLIQEVNQALQGWAAYYRSCTTWLDTFSQLDGWIRKRLRCYLLKQHQRRYPTYCFLRTLGLNQRHAWNAVLYRAWWAMANYAPVRNAMGIQWFASQGLRSIAKIQRG